MRAGQRVPVRHDDDHRHSALLRDEIVENEVGPARRKMCLILPAKICKQHWRRLI